MGELGSIESSRPIIEQCRREIETAWRHLEAARAELRRSQWLFARWDSQREDIAAPLVPDAEPFVPRDAKRIRLRKTRKIQVLFTSAAAERRR